MDSKEYHNTPGGHVKDFPRARPTQRFEVLGFTYRGQAFKTRAAQPLLVAFRCAVGVNNDKNFAGAQL